MSLIDDALKRARDEAVRQEQEGRRAPLPERLGGRPPSAGGGRALAIGAAAGILVCLLAYAALRFTARRPVDRPPPPAPTAAKPPAPLPEVFVPPPSSAPAAGSRSGAPGKEGPAKPKARSAPVSSGGAAAASPAAEEGKAAHPRDGELFTGSAALPGGARIALEGIVYSETRPVALINGKVFAPGDTVEGYALVKISPDRIELQNKDVTFWILAR